MQCFPYLYCALFLSLSFPLLRHALPNMFAIICTTLIAIELSCVYIDKHIVYRFIRSAALFTLSFSFFFICCALLPCFPLRHTHTCKNTECVFSIQICLLQQNKCEKETNNNLQFMLKWETSLVIQSAESYRSRANKIRTRHTYTQHTHTMQYKHTYTHTWGAKLRLTIV